MKKVSLAAAVISVLAAYGMAYAQTDASPTQTDGKAPVHDGANSTVTSPTTSNGDMSKGSVTKSTGYTGSTKHKKTVKKPAAAPAAAIDADAPAVTSTPTPPVTNGNASGGSTY